MSKLCVKYDVTLAEEERGSLRKLVSSGRAPARKLAHARVLLRAHRTRAGPGEGDAAIVAAPGLVGAGISA